jgi:hypothetical protein
MKNIEEIIIPFTPSVNIGDFQYLRDKEGKISFVLYRSQYCEDGRIYYICLKRNNISFYPAFQSSIYDKNINFKLNKRNLENACDFILEYEIECINNLKKEKINYL